MAKITKVAWAKSTFNGWIGCSFKSSGNSSPACERCYAETWAKRTGRDFNVPQLTSEANWKKPIKWNKEATEQDKPWRVFAFSLGDVFDPAVLDTGRDRFFEMVKATPNLIWMVLTKQHKKMYEYHCEYFGKNYTQPNLWYGVTIENQEQADIRILWLLKMPAAVRFVSVEPCLSPVVFDRVDLMHRGIPGISWLICGAETGPGARPMNSDWARSLASQCQYAGVPFFMKQMSGKEPIPDDLMIREFPKEAINAQI